MFQLYCIFHLNIAYSSIEEEQRPEVIRRCYWPLLRLAREYNLPLGIEATGYTLETIAVSDPAWVEELQRLTTEGNCEFVGSGYSQIIGPLVPSEVNAANLRLGNQAYERLLGFRPDIALVNEQAYSAGLLRHYIEAGYRAIVMEWDNPARFHPEWDADWRYFPQIACGQNGEEIPLIWNKAIAFQKFQRYAHGEIRLAEYLEYLCGHLSDRPRAFSLYGNDVEIFDFRPGRYHTEASLHEDGEWNRIDRFFEELLNDSRFRFIRPSQALDLMELPEAGNRLHLESSEQPIPVKKQEKYNITRWAVTGRDDLGINTVCWRIYESLKTDLTSNDDDWLELCYLWSSDFRTHITEKRWKLYRKHLSNCEKLLFKPNTINGNKIKSHKSINTLPADIKLTNQGNYVTVETNMVKVRFNCNRGLAIDTLFLKNISNMPLIGTLHHGYYDDISLGADYYTGHLVMESFGQPKVTDLNPVLPTVTLSNDDTFIVISGKIKTSLGPVQKTYFIDRRKSELILLGELEWPEIPLGFLRLGNITVIPDTFDKNSLYCQTHNGGNDAETLFLAGRKIYHGSPVSFTVSSSSAIGITGGTVIFGDSQKRLCITIDKSYSALIGLINYHEVGDSYFCRLALSAMEMDETRKRNSRVYNSHSKYLFYKINLTGL